MRVEINVQQVIDIATKIVLADITAGSQKMTPHRTYDYTATASRAVATALTLLKDATSLVENPLTTVSQV